MSELRFEDILINAGTDEFGRKSANTPFTTSRMSWNLQVRENCWKKIYNISRNRWRFFAIWIFQSWTSNSPIIQKSLY